MKSGTISIVMVMAVVLGGVGRAEPGPAVAAPGAARAPAAPSELGNPGLHDWIAREADNICGIASLKRVTNPARVSYDVLFAATPQVREMKRKGIDPDSAEGKALREEARTLITKSCQRVRKTQGHCSVWKAIRHQDGRAIPDVTGLVLQHF